MFSVVVFCVAVVGGIVAAVAVVVGIVVPGVITYSVLSEQEPLACFSLSGQFGLV